MARVAKCPQCENDLLVPDDAASSGLAKCPSCKSFFDLEHAESRELPQVVVVESKIDPAISQAAPTLSDLPPAVSISDSLPQGPETEEPHQLDDAPYELDTSSEESPEAAAQRIDQWFRSAKTLSDLPSSAGNPDDEIEVQKVEPQNIAPQEAHTPIGSKTIDISEMHAGGFDSDFELDQPEEAPHEAAAWDDSQDMERLLAGIENEPAHSFDEPGNENFQDSHEERYGDQVAAAEAWTPDPSMQVTPGFGEPRRKRSLVRTMLFTAFGGVVGLALGYYALLWLRGPEIDFLEVAKYLPKAALPASFQKTANKSDVSPASSILDDVAAANKNGESAPVTKDKQPAPPVATNEPPAAEEAPAEKQAAFTTPAEPPKTPAPTDDRYATPAQKPEAPAAPKEPAVLDAPPAKSLSETAPTKEPVQIIGAPSFTTEEVTTAFQVAKDAQPGLMKGNFNDGTEVKRAKGASYAAMADLAQKALLVTASASPADATKLTQEVDTLFRTTLADAHTRDEVAQIAPMWIASAHRKHGGVFFAGSVTHQEPKGSVVECNVDLGGGKSLVVLTTPAAAQQTAGSARPVGVVGSIVDKPAEKVQGYTGSATQAIYAPGLLPLE
jgi:hypothetical protein